MLEDTGYGNYDEDAPLLVPWQDGHLLIARGVAGHGTGFVAYNFAVWHIGADHGMLVGELPGYTYSMMPYGEDAWTASYGVDRRASLLSGPAFTCLTVSLVHEVNGKVTDDEHACFTDQKMSAAEAVVVVQEW